MLWMFRIQKMDQKLTSFSTFWLTNSQRYLSLLKMDWVHVFVLNCSVLQIKWVPPKGMKGPAPFNVRCGSRRRSGTVQTTENLKSQFPRILHALSIHCKSTHFRPGPLLQAAKEIKSKETNTIRSQSFIIHTNYKSVHYLSSQN